MANPTGRGGFEKGQSGNPGGRPKVVAEVQELARAHTAEAIATLVDIMHDEEAATAARVAASNAILDRGFGKAPASVNVESQGPSAAEQLIQVIMGLDETREEKTDDSVH